MPQPDEDSRIATLKNYSVLDTPADPVMDQLVRDIAATFRVRRAVISFIDEHRQWYKARVGVAVDHVPRAMSFCTHSIATDAVTVVPDARLDPRFCDNPFVTDGDGVRFYAAAPIKTLNRARIGTVCVFDSMPRDGLTSLETLRLSGYAARVAEILEQDRARAQASAPPAR
jgi:GAF domain-containing protein